MSNEIKVGDTVRVARLQNTTEVYGIGAYGTTPVSIEGTVDEEVYGPYGRLVRVGKYIYHIDDLELVEDEPVKTSGEFTIGDMVKMTSNAPAHGGDISGLVGKVVGRRGHYWGVEFDHVTDDIAQYNPYLVLQSEMGHFDPKCEWQGDEFVLAIREPLIGTVYGNIARNRNRVLNAALDDGAARVPITEGISTVIRLTPEQIAQIKEAIK